MFEVTLYGNVKGIEPIILICTHCTYVSKYRMTAISGGSTRHAFVDSSRIGGCTCTICSSNGDSIQHASFFPSAATSAPIAEKLMRIRTSILLTPIMASRPSVQCRDIGVGVREASEAAQGEDDNTDLVRTSSMIAVRIWTSIVGLWCYNTLLYMVRRADVWFWRCGY